MVTPGKTKSFARKKSVKTHNTFHDVSVNNIFTIKVTKTLVI